VLLFAFQLSGMQRETMMAKRGSDMADSLFTRNFPQYLSKPMQVLWFEIDELVIFLFTLTFALIYGSFSTLPGITVWVLFVAIQYFYTKTKRNKPRGFLKHLLYAASLIKMDDYPEYFQQEFHE
jgi:type IV conjugative transfer system protein TraL